MRQFRSSSVTADEKADKNQTVETPIRLEEALRKVEDRLALKLPTHSVLVLVNGVEASIVGGMDAVINPDDEVVIIPMFHGG